jgi:hypothetical protein
VRYDFRLTATVSGEPLNFIARDVPTAVFFHGFEETYPGAPCFSRMGAEESNRRLVGIHAWTDALLCRAIVQPRLSPELVQRLGDARDELAQGYLAAIGWWPDPELVPAEPLPAPTDRHWPDDHAAVLLTPTPLIRRGLRDLARTARVAPYEIWARWGIVECWWTWRLLLQEDMKKRDPGGAGSPSLVDLVGREPT